MAESAITEITMPEMGESVTEGTVLEWHVAVGDAVEEGQTIVEVSTDKVDAEVPAPTSGTITSLAVEVDDEVAIGAVLAEIDPSGAPVSAGDSTEAEKAEAAPTEEGDADLGEPETPVASSAPKDDDSGSAGESVTVTMPEMGESVTEGTVLEWHVAVGDKVDEGQTLIEVSTDKVDAEVPAPTAGTITKLLVEPDDEIPIGAALAELDPSGSATETGDSAPAEAGSAEASQSNGKVDVGEGRATPVARRIAAAEGLTLDSITGSGPAGKVLKADVLAASDGAAPAAEREEKVLRGPAGMLAKAMNESLKTPTATSFRTVSVDTLDAKRKGLNGALSQRGMKVSFTHLVAWAIVLAAKEWP
ncbi:MAG: biotin/lipoyl-containing protein, partial [Solirubrobacterales bacterium]